MPGTQHKRLKNLPHPRWMTKVSDTLRRRIEQHADADAESARAIFARFNLVRFTTLRTFQWYIMRRRRAMQQYRSELVRKTGKAIWKPQTLRDGELMTVTTDCRRRLAGGPDRSICVLAPRPAPPRLVGLHSGCGRWRDSRQRRRPARAR